MPVYNAEAYLRAAIESILNQTFTDFEFLIFNDASTDNSLIIINSYSDERIKVFNSTTNLGYIIHLNHGIEIAKGKYIARMDADDVSLPTRFEKQVAFLEQHSNIALVGTAAISIDEFGNEKDLIGEISPLNQLFTHLFFGNRFIHTSVMGWSDVFRKFKYNANYYVAEDYFLWSQIAMKYKVSNLQEPLVKYRTHDTNISKLRKQKQEESVKKIYNFHLKNLGVRNLNEKLSEMHFQILYNNSLPTKERDVYKALDWLKKLYTLNKKNQIYDSEIFDNCLAGIWRQLFNFNKNYKSGLKAIKYANCKLNKQVLPIEKKIFIERCLQNNKITGIFLIGWYYLRNGIKKLILFNA